LVTSRVLLLLIGWHCLRSQIENHIGPLVTRMLEEQEA
jgi:hypothetical protein